jgi:toxoflavin biosynthesis protein ToxC
MLQHTGPISGAAAHVGKYIATAGCDNRVILWERATGKPVSHASHHHVVNNCSFSPDGKHLVTSSSDCTARLWSVPNLYLQAVLADHGDDVGMSAFHPVEDLIATASRDYFVRVYDFQANLIARFNGHHADVVWLDWTHDGHQLIAISGDGEIKRWSWATKQPMQNVGPGADEHSDHALVAPNRGHGRGQVVAIKNKQATHGGAQGNRLVIDPQKSLLASVSDGTLGVWDISSANPTPIAATTLPDDVWARSCAFAGRSRLVFGTFAATHRTYDYLRHILAARGAV